MTARKSTTESQDRTGRLVDRLGRPMKHGMHGTPEYRAWQQMMQRCYNPKVPRYDRYGARGIAVCDRWRESFEDFYADMGPRPSPDHSVDRIDNDGLYEPGNCRWATREEQNRNRGDNVVLEHDGKRMTIAEWARHFGFNYRTLAQRIQKGWDVDKALTTPIHSRRWRGKPGTKREAQPPDSDTPRYLGVSWDKARCLWIAYVHVRDRERKRIYVGTFDCPTEAAIARDEASIRILGESAKLNFTEAERKRLSARDGKPGGFGYGLGDGEMEGQADGR